MQLTSFWSGKNVLGEGPIWHVEQQALYWIDIFKPALHKMDYATRKLTTWDLPDLIGCIGFTDQDNLIAAMRNEIVKLHCNDNQIEIEILAELIVGRDDLRFNDGAVDRKGRFWAGTMDLTEQNPLGALYRYDGNGQVHLMSEQFVVSNGLAWSPDNRFLYHNDSGTGCIYRYDFDFESGSINHRSIFARVPQEAGFPDGLCIDSEGFLWVAHWDGWRITRFNPDGQIDRVIKMPVARPTSCCFGGPNLDILFISSASLNLSETELQQQPQAGNVFMLDVGVQGLPEPKFKNKLLHYAK